MANLKITCLDCQTVNRVPENRLSDRPKCSVCGTALVPDKPVEVDLATLAKASRNDDLPLVVDFWAPWCGPCRMMGPEFGKAAQSLKGRARLVKLNTEAEPAAGGRYGIRGIPTMVRFASGREVGRTSGAMPAQSIVDWVTG
jgi:thioredoxin 2